MVEKGRRFQKTATGEILGILSRLILYGALPTSNRNKNEIETLFLQEIFAFSKSDICLADNR
jgi:hypothetical protein